MRSIAAAFALCLVTAANASAQVPSAPTFVTLGTNGGPGGSPERSQPANAILIGSDAYLVDIGDGACQQLAKRGIQVAQVKAVFISHLHFDHIGGLSALIGLRNQVEVPGVLTIYGPPGTKELVAGLVAATRPSARAGYGFPGHPFPDPASSVQVVELGDKGSVQVGPMKVTARQNTHYSFKPASALDEAYKSLSFRFDAPGRSIVYTGDTGPSAEVEELASGVDLLVAEMIDLPKILEVTQGPRGDSQPVLASSQNIVGHLTFHHLTPDQVGELAARAKVHSLVVTHLVSPPPAGTAADLMRYQALIGRHYSGPVMIARDLDAF